MLKSREMALPGSNQGLFKAEPRRGHDVCTLRVHPPTSPCPTFSVSPKDIAGCDIMKLKVSWRHMASLVCKGLTRRLRRYALHIPHSTLQPQPFSQTLLHIVIMGLGMRHHSDRYDLGHIWRSKRKLQCTHNTRNSPTGPGLVSMSPLRTNNSRITPTTILPRPEGTPRPGLGRILECDETFERIIATFVHWLDSPWCVITTSHAATSCSSLILSSLWGVNKGGVDTGLQLVVTKLLLHTFNVVTAARWKSDQFSFGMDDRIDSLFNSCRVAVAHICRWGNNRWGTGGQMCVSYLWLCLSWASGKAQFTIYLGNRSLIDIPRHE